VPKRIARAIHSRALAVPKGEYALFRGSLEEIDLLSPKDGRRGNVLIQSRLKSDIFSIDRFSRGSERLLQAAKWRTSVPRHIAGSLKISRAICPPLEDRQTHERLCPGNQYAILIRRVFVIERHNLERHYYLGISKLMTPKQTITKRKAFFGVVQLKRPLY
jgi:hypothetical protein